jgi:1-acyl-sn-glycerol-3-phosphate acyltransferase
MERRAPSGPVARAGDLARTIRVVGGTLAAMWRDARRHQPNTSTPEGLARVRAELATRLEQVRVTVDVTGTERVPATGGLVFMWNQTSHLDHLILPLAIPRPFVTTYNNAVRRVPIYGAYLAATGHYWLDRTDEAQWRAQIDRAAAAIRAGACVLVSPEGTRSPDGALLPMKRGAFLLARTAARPIVCVTVSGARACMARGDVVIKPGAIAIELSAPIEGEPLEERVVATFTAALRATSAACRPSAS